MAEYSLILQTVIACTAVLTALSVIFNWLLRPVKKDLARMDRDLSRVERDLKRDLFRVERELKNDFKDVNLKLDRLLSQSKTS